MTTSRAVVLSALDFMIVLIDITKNHPIFTCISDEVLYQVVRLLWKNWLGPDSLEYFDPMINSVTRVNTMKLLGGYNSVVDYDLRDCAIEFLLKLTSLSPELKQRVGKKIILTQTDNYGVKPNTKLYDALIPALTANAGRDQTPLLTGKLLENLASVPENCCGIMYLQKNYQNGIYDLSCWSKFTNIKYFGQT